MTLLDKLKAIAAAACPGYGWHYDIKQMQNVTSDDCQFPCIFMEEYYDSTMKKFMGWKREVTLEIHFLNLVPMQGVADARERVREQMLADGVIPFMDAFNADGMFEEVEEYQCDPEPPMFDANATGILVRFTTKIPACLIDLPETTPTPEGDATA